MANFMVGQPHAAKMLPAAFEAWRSGADGALVLFMAGDHGTGKSTAASILAHAMFPQRGESHTLAREDGLLPLGVLKRDGWSFKLRPQSDGAPPPRAAVDALIDEIYGDVVAQLRVCPSSLIIFDELHRVHPDIIRSLARFTETPYVMDGGERVQTSRAVFVFISDFGKESMSAHDTYDELVVRVRSLVNAVYGTAADAGVDVNRMFSYAIPFLPLDHEALLGVAAIALAELSSHPALVERGVVDVVIDPGVRHYVVRHALDPSALRESRYGRGVREAVRDHVMLRLLAAVPLSATETSPLSSSSGAVLWLSRLLSMFVTPRTQPLYLHITGGESPGSDIFIHSYTSHAVFCRDTSQVRALITSERAARARRALIATSSEHTEL